MALLVHSSHHTEERHKRKYKNFEISVLKDLNFIGEAVEESYNVLK